MSRRHRIFTLLGTRVFATAFLALVAQAMMGGPGPQTLFTDNIAAVGTSLAISSMEQALLDRIQAASISIDAAIYDFDRVSVRTALIAAHNRILSWCAS